MSNEHNQSSSLATPDSMNDGVRDPSDSSMDNQQFPIGAGNFGENDSLTPLDEEGSGSKLNSSALVLGIVLVVGGAVLFWMRSMSAKHNPSLAADNAEVESQIDSFLETIATSDSENGGDVSIIDALMENRTERQVTVDDVQKNPFILVTDDVDSNAAPLPIAKDDPKADWNRKREDLKNRMEEAAKKLIVNSIMSGDNPLASINGKIVRVGNKIVVGPDKIMFVVESIEGKTVSLTAESEEFDLQLGFTATLSH